MLDDMGEVDRLEGITVLVIKAVEAVAKDTALHGNNFAWLLAFCAPTNGDSLFMTKLRMHLREELAILEALEQIDLAKSLVAYFKRSGLNSHLESRLQNPPDTRWIAKCPMLRSVEAFCGKGKRNKR